MLAVRYLNVGIKAVTLASRFAFIFLIARILEPSEIGIYGLFTATVGYLIYLLGFDFYTYSNRSLLQMDRTQWGIYLKSQAILYAIAYIFIVPICFVLLQHGLLPGKLLGWLLVLLFLEHFNQEIFRLLIVVAQPTFANVLMFVRQGSWALGAVAVLTLNAESRHLEFIFQCWTAAGVLAALSGLYRLKSMKFGHWRGPIQWHWIWSGVKVCVPFLLATLALRAISTLDRYWLQYIQGADAVGAFVLYAGVASVLMAFLESGIFAFTYPILISAHHKADAKTFSATLASMLKHIGILSAGFAVVSLLVLDWLLAWIGNPFYQDYRFLYYWLLLATVLNAFGMIPHYGLYALGHDKAIISGHIVGLAVFLTSTAAVASVDIRHAVPVGICAAFAFIMTWKLAFFLKLAPTDYRQLELGKSSS